ncbi:DNA polymerase III subunit [bacterium]|nr:DNA polymerase III subunit [bacterium]
MAEKKRINGINNEFMNRLTGHEEIKRRLLRLAQSGRLPHAVLFHGPAGSGKEAAGLELGKYLMCQADNPPCGLCKSCLSFSRFEHPDFHFLFPIPAPEKEVKDYNWEAAMSADQADRYREQLDEKRKNIYHHMQVPKAQNILIAQVRQLIRNSFLTPYLSANRFALISPADRMNKESQNSLLKLLEEPPERFYLCLVTSNLEALLPTIISRTQMFYFPPLKIEELAGELQAKYNLSESKAVTIAVRSGGSLTKAVELVKGDDAVRQSAMDFLTEILKKNPIGIYQFAFDMRYKEKETAKEILKNIDVWLGDIARMDAGLPPKINPDIVDRLDKFRNNIQYENLEDARRLTQEAIDLVDKNVYLDMICTNLANDLDKIFVWKRKAV